VSEPSESQPRLISSPDKLPICWAQQSQAHSVSNLMAGTVTRYTHMCARTHTHIHTQARYKKRALIHVQTGRRAKWHTNTGHCGDKHTYQAR